MGDPEPTVSQETTYDPVLESDELRRVRVTAPPARPRFGTALVLEPHHGAPVVVWQGQRVPGRRLGAYARSYLVDIAPHTVRIDETLPCSDPAFTVQCSVSFQCAVRDPGAVAQLNVRDVAAVLRGRIVWIMRQIARQFDIQRINEAEMAIDRELRRYDGEAAIVIATDSYLVALSSTTPYHEVTRGIRLDDMRRGAMDAVVEGGEKAVYAHWIANQDGDAASMLTAERQAQAAKLKTALEVTRVEAGEEDDDFDTRRLRSRLREEVLHRALDDGGGETGATRRRGRRRERLGIAAGAGQDDAIDAVVEDESP